MTTKISEMKVRGKYSFSVYPSPILGDGFKGCTILTELDPETARLFEDIDALHAKVYPYLPSGTTNDANSYNYFRVKLTSGSVAIVGSAWIIEETVTVVENIDCAVTIRNILTTDAQRIRDVLSQNGFSDFDIKITTIS